MPEAVLDEHKADSRVLLGPGVDAPEPKIAVAAVGENVEAFKAMIRDSRAGSIRTRWGNMRDRRPGQDPSLRYDSDA